MLTLEEFKQMTGVELTEATFDRLLKESLTLLNAKTLHRFTPYYATATGAALEACNACLAGVIKYQAELSEVKTSEPSGKWVKAETVGNHRVEYAGGAELSADATVAIDREVGALVVRYLEPLGLTYRGVDVC